jgi:tetratricopeptide (TPR) repeat protein
MSLAGREMRHVGASLVRGPLARVGYQLRQLTLLMARSIEKNRRPTAARFAATSHQHLLAGDWESARYDAQLAVASDPLYADGYRMLGHAFLRLGQDDAARQAFEQGMRATAGDARLATDLGDMEMELPNPARAEAAFRRALERSPNDSEALNRLAWALSEQGRVAEADDLVALAHAEDPESTPALFMLGMRAYREGNMSRAAELLARAIDLGHSSPDVYFNLALARVALGKWEEALEPAREAVKLDPGAAERSRLLWEIESHPPNET